MEIFNTNRTLFYYLFNEHVVEFNPIVYDPVIAESIEQYSDLFVDPQYAAFLSYQYTVFRPDTPNLSVLSVHR